MTSAMALTCFAVDMPETCTPDFRRLFEWHLAEEVEHRTVTFEAYEHLVGGHRFSTCLLSELGAPSRAPYIPLMPNVVPRYLRTLTPWYHPGKIEAPAAVTEILSKYAT